MRLATQSNGRPRRQGVTLVEMLVVVALLVLMMTILASIFQQATSAISVSRTYQELDNNLKFLDMTIRQDLAGVTAKMTPPNNPALKQGYFEYGENAPADAQGEDTDDYLAMTVKAPEGISFSGRVWLGLPANQAIQPVTITSRYAEIIYFLRNGNLYRRVLLIAPERKSSGFLPTPTGGLPAGLYTPAMFNSSVHVSWPGMNDISARPPTASLSFGTLPLPPIPNDLGDLTNRENRYARQRFGNDYWNSNTLTAGRDGIIDDENFDGIPDYWPTLTFSQVHAASLNGAGGPFAGLMNEDASSKPGGVGGGHARIASADAYCFPFIYPNMFSVPEATSVGNTGWLHALDSRTVAGVPTAAGVTFNHAPLEFGDSLPGPATAGASALQTWWGFPTWRETASGNWRDPAFGPTDTAILYPGQPGTGISTSTIGHQALGLQPNVQNVAPAVNANMLPIVGAMPPLGTPSSYAAPYGFDQAGFTGSTSFLSSPVAVTAASPTQLAQVWEDDLIMTGVRSFDVKAYDASAPLYNLGVVAYNAGYYDLGYASSDYVRVLSSTALVTGTPIALQDTNGNPQGFGHEGRMPPLTADFRFDPQRPFIKGVNSQFIATIPNNVGDNTANAFAPQRIRRVWDSWSTDYTNAPAVDINLRGSPIQNFPLDKPIYPSYPPPYPQALRGIQIQIRVGDAKNERIKILTIRHDFSDKL